MEENKRVILITGASSGIGRELAYQLAEEENAHLILVSRRIDALEKVAKKCEANANVTTEVYAVDISDKEQVGRLLENIDNIDILINAAGYGIMKPFDEFSDSEVDEMFYTNVLGTIQITSAIAKKMKEKKSGSIVTISSISGKIATPNTSIYSATKFSLIGYFNSLRLELRDSNVHVMVVNPGPIATNFFNTANENKEYLKILGGKTLSPKALVKKIIRGINKKSREINVPFNFGVLAKISVIFPKISDNIIFNMFKKK